MMATLLAGLMALTNSHQEPPSTSYQTFSAMVYADSWQKHLPRDWVAAYNIAYASSFQVAATDYGNRKRRCRYTLSNFTLSRRFTYEGLHQAKPYKVMHLQSGLRSWTRSPPAASGDVAGNCADVLGRVVAPIAASANALPTWKAIVDEDDGIVRRFLLPSGERARKIEH